MKKTHWFNHILSFGREYKHRNYLKNVTFTLLNMNRCNWKWFRLETILNNIDMKKAYWVNHVISIDRQYKHRNYLKHVTFTLLTMNRGNCDSGQKQSYSGQKILNNIDMKKASWFKHNLSLGREYKHRN